MIPSNVLTQIVGAIRDARFGSEIRLIEENLLDLLQRLSEHTVDIALLPETEYASSIRSAPVWRDPLYYVPRRGVEVSADEVDLKSLGADTCSRLRFRRRSRTASRGTVPTRVENGSPRYCSRFVQVLAQRPARISARNRA